MIHLRFDIWIWSLLCFEKSFELTHNNVKYRVQVGMHHKNKHSKLTPFYECIRTNSYTDNFFRVLLPGRHYIVLSMSQWRE